MSGKYNMQIPKRPNNRGVAFFMSLALLLLLSMGAIVFFALSYNYANVSESSIRRARAITIAEAGVNYAYWKLRIDQDDSGDPISDNFPLPGTCTLTPPISLPTGWTIEVAITEDVANNRKVIRSTVTYPKTSVL